jgi:hypothetical protein
MTCTAKGSFDHLVGSAEQGQTEGYTETFAVLRLSTNAIFAASITGKSSGFAPLRMRAV